MISSIYWDGSNWNRIIDGLNEIHLTATGPYPPRTGWPTSTACEYDSNWIGDSGSPIERDYDSFINASNIYNKELMKISKLGESDFCHIVEDVLYSQTLDENTEWFETALTFIGDVDCGAGYMEPVTVDGAYVMHDGDLVIQLKNGE